MIKPGLLLAALAIAVPVVAAPPEPVSHMIAEGDGSLTLVHEVEVPASAAQVWMALSSAEGWMTWAVPLARSVDGEPDLLETSYDPVAAPGGPETIRHRFVARIPGRMLAFRTVKAPASFPDFDTFAKVESVIELVPRGHKRTLVRLTGVGYPNDAAGRQMLAIFDKDNKVALEMLRVRFVEGPIDWSTKLGKP